MKSGLLYGNAAMLDGIVDRMEEELGEPATVLATGGLASLIVPLCKKTIILDDNLLLRGLNLIYKKNQYCSVLCILPLAQYKRGFRLIPHFGISSSNRKDSCKNEVY